MRIQHQSSKLLAIGAVLVYVLVCCLFSLPCPIRHFTGIPCFGCGMTHALLSVLRLDFAAAFTYHAMFWSVPLLFWCFLKDGKIFTKPIYNTVFYIVIAIGYVLNWALRLLL